jgi:hypothetical protein
MTSIRFSSMPTDQARAYWAGAPDANGQEPEIHVSDGDGVPCRHCQQDVAKGETYLILAYRPFPKPQPYAEIGPIFLHADPCARYPETDRTPVMFLKRESYLLKGYAGDDRIVYGTGQIVGRPTSPRRRPGSSTATTAYVHVRSALNNCFACRIDRARIAGRSLSPLFSVDRWAGAGIGRRAPARAPPG